MFKKFEDKVIKRSVNFYKNVVKDTNISFFKRPVDVKGPSVIFFPVYENQLNCGLTGIVTFKKCEKNNKEFEIEKLKKLVTKAKESCINSINDNYDIYLNGQDHLDEFSLIVSNNKNDEAFNDLLLRNSSLDSLKLLFEDLKDFINSESDIFKDISGQLSRDSFDIIFERIETLKDIQWVLEVEIYNNIQKIQSLINKNSEISLRNTEVFKKINTVLNSIDRLEVRGRDSAGISVMFIFEADTYHRILMKLEDETLDSVLSERRDRIILENKTISIRDFKKDGENLVSFNITYKVAAEIGSLGDNIRYIRQKIKNDQIIQLIANESYRYNTVSAHTRWASVGAITVPNCHPVDNMTTLDKKNSGIIHVSLNGDIDNYLELKEEFENNYDIIPEELTTDTKIIPVLVEMYVKQGQSVENAFLMAVNDFEGSHAISMHTDLAPGKLFLAQRGSGQAIFIGISDNNYMAVSEVYGLVEETSKFIRVDGETVIEGKSGPVQGQIFILDQNSGGGLSGMEAMYYDGSKIELTEDLIKKTDIKTRDIDRQGFNHYFLKEISESPISVEKTIQNRWKANKDDTLKVVLDESHVPEYIISDIKSKKIKRIFFMGQGTAGIAAQVCADLMSYYLSDSSIFVSAIKSSELSGFHINEMQDSNSMSDTIVIAISQSGTTTDTNRAVDMVKEKGARTLAIVNRRDSDLSFKVDGVIYTSSGRDLEMSVASTKAFYSQIIAGSILGLYVSSITEKMCPQMVNDEIKELLKIPDVMRKILSMKDEIKASAMNIAVKKTYWAAVGSGPNKASADEIRIKLSELCYKTISTDYIEDKKHIDLSSEPLIIVCAAGTRRSVLGDIIKDTAIFNAHKATTVVITDEGEDGFDSYSENIFKVPYLSEHLAPISNTLVGHIWGYYAALAINEGSRFMYKKREQFNKTINSYAHQGLNVYEVILEKKFREEIATFYKEFRKKRLNKEFPPIMGFNTASDLTLLLKYLSGRLPVSDFEIDFAKKGTPLNMLDTFFECIGDSINCMARPIDAIKHQAKTVTVGTSRISDSLDGSLFEVLKQHNVNISQVINKNVIVMKNLQAIISNIKGTVLYKISGIDVLGEPDDNTKIEIIEKTGELKNIESRVESDNTLRGTKKIIVREGNAFIGKGKKDDRMTLVIPIISKKSTTYNVIENLISLNVALKKDDEIPLFKKVKALGGKHERLRNIVQESSLKWDDSLLNKIPVDDLFGLSAEKVVENYLV
ncbi:MAG: SIS domain-containing protein [Deltaproteobacteria bacterium]|nr:SIS domain-containing protein [Deltaproteobacteria bacterium]